MSLGELLRNLIVAASAFVVGLSVYVVIRDARVVARQPWRWWALMHGAGVAIVVALVAEAVARSPFIPSSWRAWLYVAGLLMLSAGTVGLLLRERTRKGHR